jgi:DNA-binding beta-propeller fold protein YncE
VFVALNKLGPGVVEFPAGLRNCGNETTLGVLFNFAGGMQLDNRHNLVICDQIGQTVDIVAPPYTIVTRFIFDGFADPFHVALNKYNTLMFVADVSNRNVKVLKYPSGTPVTTLDRSNGLSDPAGVVTNPFQH